MSSFRRSDSATRIAGGGCHISPEIFERRESIAEHEAVKPKCPKCGSEVVVRAFSSFYAKTAKKS